MNIGGIGQVGHVNEAARAEVATASARAQPVVIGFGPMTEAARDNGLAMPRAGVSAARPPMMRVAGGEGHLLAEARAHFVRERPEVVSALRRAYADITQPVVDEIADEWVARSLRRYSALLDGRNDGLQYLTPSGLLLTIAFEGQRPEGDPVRVLAEGHQARFIESLARNGESTEEATFQARTIGARLARSTAGWEAELGR